MSDDSEDLVPTGQPLFPLKAEDIIDNAFQNLSPNQAREVSRKAAEEALRLEVERRKASLRTDSAQQEIRNVIENANLLDQRGGDYKIDSKFETASGTTSVQITKSKSVTLMAMVAVVGILVLLLAIVLIAVRY
ncbi:MAG TPA: hypothetical protein VE961_23605 [Pyrinomonadaceae bacterium]|nr:hypothetical protein [Pyrinomonadaceae bacterium]